MKAFLRRYWLAVAICLVFVSIGSFLWAWGPSRLAVRTLMLYPHILAELPAPLARLQGPQPQVETLVFAAPNGLTVEADVYRPPGSGPHGALLVVMGAAPEARHHPQAVRLAQAVARMGRVVMLPVLPYLSHDVLHPDDKEAVVASFLYLRALPYVESNRIGILGFSIGQGIAFAAAADPRISQLVHSVGSFGGYYDVRELIAAVATGAMPTAQGWQRWQPAPRARQVLQRSLLYYVPDARERERLAIALEVGRLPLGEVSLTASLIYQVLNAQDPLLALQALSQAPPELARVLDILSPRTHLQNVRAPVFIVADRHDPFVPYTQSRALRDELRAMDRHAIYSELTIFRHVTPALQANPLAFLADIMRLWGQGFGFLARLR